jgi:hypothetical protein
VAIPAAQFSSKKHQDCAAGIAGIFRLHLRDTEEPTGSPVALGAICGNTAHPAVVLVSKKNHSKFHALEMPPRLEGVGK